MANKMSAAGFFANCSRCSERIQAGQFYDRKKSEFWHTGCSVAEPAPAPAAPSRSAVAAHRTFGALHVDESFARWEREYEQEG